MNRTEQNRERQRFGFTRNNRDNRREKVKGRQKEKKIEIVRESVRR